MAWTPKPDEIARNNFQSNIPYELRCKNSEKNINM